VRKLVPATLVLLLACGLLPAQTPPAPDASPAPPAPPAPATPPAANPALDLAKAKFREGDFTAAAAAAADALAIQPESTVAHYIAGASMIRLSRLDDAETHLKAVLEKVPNMNLLHYQLGLLAYRRAEEAEKSGTAEQAKPLYLAAAKEFGTELEKTPTQVASLASRAAALAHAGETDEAVPAHEAWIAVAADSNDPYLSLASVYANAGRIDEAFAQLDRLPKKDPKVVVDAATALALPLYAKQRYYDAGVLAAKALEIDPTSKKALTLVIASHANAGEVGETAVSLRKYLDLNPTPEEVEEVADVVTQRLGDEGASMVPSNIAWPLVIKPVKPRYPSAAGNAKIETKVLVLAQIKVDDTIGEIVVVPSRLGKDLTEKGFAQAGIDAVKKGKYRAGTKDGKPVDMYLPVTVRFTP
jgi:tetratricopeptide (TPR) repeat protein